MSTITITDGDFGEATVTFGAETIYLPDRLHPGLSEAVPLAHIAGIEAVDSDRSGQLKKAVSLSASGFLTAGPVGLAAGLLAVRTGKDIVFTVILNDGRKFTATADAVTYADFHAAQVAARGAARLEDAANPADDIIARYLAKQVTSPAAVSSPRQQMAADPRAPEPIRNADRALSRATRPTFGKRRTP